MDKKQVQMELASYIGRTLRENFGKGPESVFVSLGDTILTVYLRNFISPMENVLLGQKQEMMVQRTREILMGTLIPEMKAYIKILTGVEVREFYYDWSLQNNSGAFVCIGSNFAEINLDLEYEGKQALQEEISAVSMEAQKEPEEILSFLLNDRTLVVLRKGILVPIEKELIMLGNYETLKMAKRNLEKRLLHNRGKFPDILQAKVSDIFVDWDFQLDKSAIVLILSPTT